MELGKNQRWKERRGRGKREESSSKKGGCRFSNCNETRHRRVAWVSYDDQTTDDDAVFLSPRILLLFIPYDTTSYSKETVNPPRPNKRDNFIPYHVLPINENKINESFSTFEKTLILLLRWARVFRKKF